MADATRVPELVLFQWAKPDAPNPRLAAPISSTDTTITFTAAPKDKNGNIITGFFNFGIRNNAGYVENVHVPAGGMSVDGLTATGCIRGVGTSGYDYDTSVAGLAVDHEQDSPVSCNVTAVLSAIIEGALTGDIASTILFYLAATVPNYTDATARDAAITSPTNGMVVTTGGVLQYYSGGSWTDTGTGSATPNASTTVAGKVEIATQSEANAGTNTGGTGALLSVIPSNLAVLAQDNKYTYAGTTAGSSTVYTATVTPAPAAYAAGQGFTVLMDETNGASPTINFNGLGAKNIVDANGTAIGAGTLPSGALVNLMYNGTNFQVMNFTLASGVTVYTSTQTRGGPTSQFDITNPSGDTFRYTWDGTGTNPNISLANFPVGSLVGIFSNDFASGNCGVFTVTGAGTNYFEVTNYRGVVESNKDLLRGFLNQSVDSFAIPANAKSIAVEIIGAGGGGGYGSSDNNKGAGGGGGAFVSKLYRASTLTGPVPVLVGGGGVGGVFSGFVEARHGGYSAFGSYGFAGGGGSGENGTPLRGGGGGGGTGGTAAIATSGAATLGGLPATTAGAAGISGQGAGGNSGAGASAEFGGAAGGEGSTGGSSLFGGAGGGGGGRGSTAAEGNPGGSYGSYVTGGGADGGAGSAGTGGTGNNGTSRSGFGCGDGGGGGGGSSAGTGGVGGNGGSPGGGGGGGGGGAPNGGNGGNGGQGEVRVYVYY